MFEVGFTESKGHFGPLILKQLDHNKDNFEKSKSAQISLG